MAILLSNQTPGGPVDPEGYAGQGVRFAADSALVQAVATVADSSKLTISMWVRRTGNALGYLFRADKDPVIPVAIRSPGLLQTDVNIGATSGNGLSTAFYNTVNGLTANEWHHVFISIDLNHASGAKLRQLYLDGEVWTESNASNYPIDPGGAFSMGLNGAEIGFPTTSFAIDDEGELEQPAADYSDVQIWIGTYIDPVVTQTRYSAKASASRIVRDVVNYMNSRGVSPVEALAVMKIESNFGTLSRNYFQFLNSSSFNSILGYTGSTTNNTDLNRALANAWTSLRPNGSAVPAPNNYSAIVRSITGEEPLGWQNFVIHNLGGSVSAIGGPGSINGYRLLAAWELDDTLALGDIGGLTLMTAQTSIYGSNGPIGLVTNSTTVAAAVGAMISVWNDAETAALAKLDANTQSNLSYFIDDDGFAVPPAAATDIFGLQTFLFTGGPEDFIENEGSGGAVTLTGTVTASTDGPNG